MNWPGCSRVAHTHERERAAGRSSPDARTHPKKKENTNCLSADHKQTARAAQVFSSDEMTSALSPPICNGICFFFALGSKLKLDAKGAPRARGGFYRRTKSGICCVFSRIAFNNSFKSIWIKSYRIMRINVYILSPTKMFLLII